MPLVDGYRLTKLRVESQDAIAGKNLGFADTVFQRVNERLRTGDHEPFRFVQCAVRETIAIQGGCD